MRRLLAPLLLLAAFHPLCAQIKGGLVVDPARSMLVRAWNPSANAKERLYCITRWSVDMSGYVYVMKVEPAIHVTGATPYQVSGECILPNEPLLHTHPAGTCDWVWGADSTLTPVRCVRGGLDAWQCFPSPIDQQTLVDFKLYFGVIQCSRHAFVFYQAPSP